MFRHVESLVDQLRHFALNPPLAPGGRDVASTEAVVVDEDGVGSIATYGDNSNNNKEPLILRYLPLLVLLTLFWPVLLTLFVASVSASAWLFWLCVGAAFGVLQLLYVLYNFAMIVWDLAALTLLKTFAMLRSFVRYYFYKMSDAAGMSGRGSKRRHSKKRRRKEWREDEDRATSYEEYCRIEIYEPEQNNPSARRVKVARATPGKPKGLKRATSVDVAKPPGTKPSMFFSVSSPIPSGAGSRLRKRIIPSAQSSGEERSTPPSKSGQYSPSGSPMRRATSSNDLNKTPRTGSRRRGSSFRGGSSAGSGDSDSHRPLRRVSSAFPLSGSFDEEDNHWEGEESCPLWQQAVEEDLGMTGNMLLTTLSRLKEARMQCSSMNLPGKNANGDDDDGYGDDDSRHSNASDDDMEPSFHITEFSKSSPKKGKQRGRNEDYSSSLKTLLSGIVKRNHLSVDDFLMQDARSVAERGQHSLRRETREAIDRYGEEVERCMDWVASGTVYLGRGNGDGEGDDAQSSTTPQLSAPERIMRRQHEELSKRHTLFRRMKQNMGHTALMLSGGGAQAMYHLGTIKALCESKLYEHIHVISGTSGGSIAAAMCAIKTPEELLSDICVNTVSTDYMLTGEMERKNVSWFPELYKMGLYWLKHRLLMDSKEFLRCCEFYYKDITFEEAFEMTGKHVCITVSASRASAGSGVQRLLLNHISTPNVTLASSVAASCAVPGVMAPAKLMIKDSRGKKVPFEVDGVEWIDGSVQADLPFKRISTLFNISNFVVAQTNFHVVPFLNKAHHPNINTLYWKMFQMCMWDVRSRVLNLSQLGLFPKIFGQDLSKMFKQKYFGKLTLVPRFTTLQLFGLKVLSNPTVADMSNYLQHGQLAAWPFLRVLKEMLRFERSIEAGLAKLDQRLRSVADFPLPNDDVDSLSSAVGTTYRARLPGLGREAELLKERVRGLEQENKQLRQQVMRLQRTMGISHPVGGSSGTLEGRLVSVSTVEEDDDARTEEKKVS
eukprot:CAMPEP_0172532972 /NCGR_PEP_ID=MMETSP1067-20121228/5828_1 /TAXON_ID=265564 ORGANISM="Thalassiosira punctigera, Strain Tpunct2005C2" /NCGR_SAMPLE_ID=MMETSP1067 /ASSEMBLY_ACC=CAM_ASM_000444 /LENGTH=1002 /DNA_ID=CAMNT_0013317549 /DNA_START=112 /DNA_END=3120 /DNA_ORIENTATION=+